MPPSDFPLAYRPQSKKLQQAFDNKTQEHMIYIEYGVKVNAGKAQKKPTAPTVQAKNVAQQMPLLRELLVADN
jgi:hypothetical protein